MTAQEISQMFGYTVTTIEHQFTRTQKSIVKKFGMYVTKNGNEYFVRPLENAADFAQVNEEGLVFNTVDFVYETAEVLIITALALLPSYSYFGNPQGFLRVLDASIDGDTMEIFSESIFELVDKEYIVYDEDEEFINMRLTAQMIKDLCLEEAKLECKRIEQENRMRKNGWIRLFKTWIVLQTCSEELSDVGFTKFCGSSATWMNRAKPLLKNTDMYKRSGEFRKTAYYKLDKKLQSLQKRLFDESSEFI